ncbi:hypothetical protein QAD02_010799 [Eretmocerus hayati]|uniref:Uncharacterized protein n=1 Tax=Eretmocerus hayati TaxID=131215 RepID=A0ACC2NVV8_9HYME|nr:hypothetical protein QAD02_010799 [Eretmocerus hayati]
MMAVHDRIVAVCTIVILVSIDEITGWKTVVRQIGSSHNTNLIADRDSIDNMTLAYALCDKNHHEYRMDCSIILENTNFDGIMYADRCDLRFETEQGYSHIGTAMKVRPFGSNKAIIRWTEVISKTKIVIKLRTVSFPGCRWTETHIYDGSSFEEKVAIHWIQLLVYKDTYDILFRNSSFCFKERCRSNVNSTFSGVASGTPWLKAGYTDNVRVDALAPRSQDGGHLVTVGGISGTKVSVVHDDRPNKLLLDLPNSYTIVTPSTSHHFVGLCAAQRLPSKTVRCVQWNRHHTKILDTNIVLGYETRDLYIHNMAFGGFLLLTSSDRGGYAYYVTKISSREQRYRSVQIVDFKCDMSIDSQVVYFQNNSEELCISFMCFIPNAFRLVVKCLPDKDLSVPY